MAPLHCVQDGGIFDRLCRWNAGLCSAIMVGDPTEVLPVRSPVSEPAPARPSSSIAIVRDGTAGLEAFMIVRAREVDFASGASVFPGGRITDDDRDPRLRALSDGAEALDDDELAYRIAAIREGFEECGLVLARTADGTLAGPAVAARLDDARLPVERGERMFADVLEGEGLRLACDLLVPFGLWITPDFVPKRFETRFYLAPAPRDQNLVHDGSEAVASEWLGPAATIEEADAGRRALVFATRMNLMRLAEHATVAAALAAEHDRPIVPVQPWVEDRADGRTVCISADAGYAISAVPVDVARGGPWPDSPALPPPK